MQFEVPIFSPDVVVELLYRKQKLCSRVFRKIYIKLFPGLFPPVRKLYERYNIKGKFHESVKSIKRDNATF
jgi:hypothetical protein